MIITYFAPHYSEKIEFCPDVIRHDIGVIDFQAHFMIEALDLIVGFLHHQPLARGVNRFPGGDREACMAR